MRLVNDTDREYWEVDFRRYEEITQEDLVVCPYCFTERELHSDEFEYDDEFEDEEYCYECGKTFKVEAEVRYECIPNLNNEYIESAKLTAFNPSSIDLIIKQYEDLTLVIHKHVEDGKEDKLNRLCELYNNYLLQLSNHVSPWVAGRSNYKAKTTTPIDKALRAITDYVEEITKELEVIDYRKNKDKYDKKEKDKKVNRLIGEIGYFQDINKKLFYERLVELHDIDKNIFKKVHKALGEKIANNSKAAKLYRELEES